jgi:hypothetical protein
MRSAGADKFLATALVGFTAAGAGAGLIPGWQVWLGYGSADGSNRIASVGLVGWLGWTTWIVAYSITLLCL